MTFASLPIGALFRFLGVSVTYVKHDAVHARRFGRYPFEVCPHRRVRPI